jgi:ankyrin repeat protein
MTDLTTLIDAIQGGDGDRVQSIVDRDPALVNQRDSSGATPLHYATLLAHRAIVQLLLDHGANINAQDSEFGATPAGWAIEYLRERDAYLAIELDDLAYAIANGDARWVGRFLARFPHLRRASDTRGTPFQELARESGHRDIIALFADSV